MTKQILKYMALVAIMGISSIAIISCNNDEDETKMDKQTVVGTQKAAPQEYELGKFYHEITENTDSMWCVYTEPGNCLHPVEIFATRIGLINNFCRSIAMNEPIAFIERNRTELAEYFNSEDLDGVVNGTLDLSCNVNDKTFIIFKNNRTGEVAKAYPFILSE